MPRMNFVFELLDLAIEFLEVIKQPLDEQSERTRQLAGSVFDQLEDTHGNVADALRHDEAELAQKPADLIRLRGARPYESLPNPVQRQVGLLLDVLHRDEAHVRPP